MVSKDRVLVMKELLAGLCSGFSCSRAVLLDMLVDSLLKVWLNECDRVSDHQGDRIHLDLFVFFDSPNV